MHNGSHAIRERPAVSAMWQVELMRTDNGGLEIVYLSSADAKSLKSADIQAARAKAAMKAEAKLWKQQRVVGKVINVRCVG